MSIVQFNNEQFNPSVEHKMIEYGFRPSLYTVANGSYASNASYGAGAAQVNSYSAIQLPRGNTSVVLTGTTNVNSPEGCNIRVNGNRVDFTCSVLLNAAADPGYTTQEVRIKARAAGNEVPVRTSVGLPRPSVSLPLPLFDDVQILTKLNAQLAPDTNAAADVLLIQARLLSTGDLAFVLDNRTTSVVRGLQHADFNAGFGAGNAILITVRGNYLTN